MVSSEYWFGAEASFYNGAVSNSVRLNGSTGHFRRTLSESGSRRKATWSFWLKHDTKKNSIIYSKGNNVAYADAIYFEIRGNSSGSDFYSSSTIDDSQTSLITTTRKFRDPSAWYHFVIAFDTEQGTASDRMKLYVNGVQETVGTFTYPSQNTDMAFGWYGSNSGNDEVIGDYDANESSNHHINGCLAEFHYIDGTQLTPTSFGEFKNGIWIPKEYTGSHGTIGYHLKFDQTGTGTASSSTVGADSSGNNNHWTSSGIDSSDCNMPDSPENNFPTFNPLHGESRITQSEGSLRAVTSSSGNFQDQASSMAIPKSGKWYFEVRKTAGGSSIAHIIGISEPEAGGAFGIETSSGHMTASTSYKNVAYYSFSHKVINSTFTSGYGATWATNDIIGVAVNVDDGDVTFYKNGASQGTLSSVLDADATYLPAVSAGASCGSHANFGQDSTFSGLISAGGNADANGIGDFAYAPPSGFLALCSANLPEPTISPNADTQADDHFNTVLFSGTGSSPLSVTGVGFQPDWLWLKRRDNATNGHHILYDSIRGGTNALRASSNTAESQFGDMVITFASDGFSFTGTDGLNNSSSYSNVAWNWLGNGTTPTKTYKVVVVSDSGNKYRFRNSADSATFAQSAVTLELQEGGTYTFDLSDSSVDGHPMKFSTTSNGSHGGGSTYSTGVVYKLDGVTKTESEYVSGFNSATTRQIIITVASSAPVLYYFCHYHSGMGGQINTNTTHGSTNFDGSILSVSNPNTTSGFSIVTYTGSSSGNNGTASTIGHGLGIKPQWIWFIPRDTFDGCVYHSGVASDPATDKLLLATGSETDAKTGASDDSGFFNDTEPTTTVFSVGTRKHSNSNGGMVAYCFAEVESYSKFGSFIGNGSTDGTFVFTGFRPAWIMTKETSNTSTWNIYDNVRSDDNPATELLIANSYNAEGTGTDIDIVSNGFKVRSSSGNINTSGNNYIYIAFAHMPFKYALAR